MTLQDGTETPKRRKGDMPKTIPEMLEENARKAAHYRRMAFILAVSSIVLASLALYLRMRVQ